MKQLRYLLLAGLMGSIASFAGAMGGSAPAAAEPAVCWRPSQLAGRPGENRIAKGTPSAYMPAPRGQPRPLRSRKGFTRGAIRRVELPGGQKVVALTFDLCEQPYEITGYQGDIVDYLRKNRIHATFFAGGKWMLTHVERTQQLMADPLFEVANHSWEHRNFRLLDQARLGREIDAAQLAYEQVRDDLQRRNCRMPDGRVQKRDQPPPRMSLFRFPFGACNSEALAAVNDRGLMAIQWDVSSADPWKGMTADKMVKHVLARTRPGSILIFHANGRGWHTGAALPRIIAGLKAKGFRFATVSQLLAIPGARAVTTATCYNERPGDSDRYDDIGRRLEVQYERFYTTVKKPARKD